MDKKTEYFKAIAAIAMELDAKGVPFTINNAYEGYQLRFPWCRGDVVCHAGITGAAKGRVETYRFPWDNGDVTLMTPKIAAERISDYYAALYFISD